MAGLHREHAELFLWGQSAIADNKRWNSGSFSFYTGKNSRCKSIKKNDREVTPGSIIIWRQCLYRLWARRSCPGEKGRCVKDTKKIQCEKNRYPGARSEERF